MTMAPGLILLEPGNYVVSHRVKEVLSLDGEGGSSGRKFRTQAKGLGRCLNTSGGKATRTVLILNSGHVILTSKSCHGIREMLA